MPSKRPGGLFATQNKKYPGAYYNVKAVPKSKSNLGDRGILAIPLEMDWGKEGINRIKNADLQKKSLELFGYSYEDDKLKPLREMFRGAKELLIYRLNEGAKARVVIGNLTAEAIYSGKAGNDLKVVITEDIDTSSYIVSTYYKTQKVDSQYVVNMEDLKSNAFLNFKGKGAIAQTEKTAGTNLEGGTNKSKVTTIEYQSFLEAIEPYDFDILAYAGNDNGVKVLFESFTNRMRKEEGVLFQTVLYRYEADNKGIISVWNNTQEEEAALVYWIAGQEAGCLLGQTISNLDYDGEYKVIIDFSEKTKDEIYDSGYILLDGISDNPYVVEDVNTFKSFSVDEPESLAKNQVIRVIDQRIKSISNTFITKYMGKSQNDDSSRMALWNDCVKNAELMEEMRAIRDYDSKDTEVLAGDTLDSVIIRDGIKPVMAMQKIYMYVNIIE